jgi:hypothetical protein
MTIITVFFTFYTSNVLILLIKKYIELVMRGLSSTFAPTLQPYIDEGLLGGAGVASVDGGYYTHTRDNKPVLGAVPGVEGAHICAAFSGAYLLLLLL